jgi:hypothetical protein
MLHDNLGIANSSIVSCDRFYLVLPPPVRVKIVAAPVDFSLLSLSSYVSSQVVSKEPIPGKTFRLAYSPNASGS